MIINYSGGGPASQEAIDAVNYANTYGVLIVASAGNNCESSVSYPAAYSSSYSNVIAVSATDQNDVFSEYSNKGSQINVSAPGGHGTTNYCQPPHYVYYDSDDIYSTTPNYAFNIQNDHPEVTQGYGYLAGTSMAAPQVTGTAALVLSLNPNLTPSQIRTTLQLSADDKGSSGRDDYYGYGRINANKAVHNLYVPQVYSTIQPALSVAISGQKILVTGSQTVPSNLLVQSGVTLNITSSATLNLNGYTISQNGGVITVEDGAVINGALLKTGGTINAIYPSIQAALNASSSGQTIEVISSQTVSSDLSITTGRTLAIDDGTTITFSQNTGLTVNGKLTAIGTSQNKITFGGDEWWDGIIFNDVSDNSSQISYATIFGAVYGIKCYKANPTITWNQLSGNQYGVHVTNASPTIRYNYINQNVGSIGSYTGVGIYVWETNWSAPNISNNRIFHNTYGLLFVSVAHQTQFNDNDIYDNHYNFYAKDYSAPPFVYSGSDNNFYFQSTEWYDVVLRNGTYVDLFDNWWEEYPADNSEFDVDGSSVLNTFPELMSQASHSLPKRGTPVVWEQEKRSSSNKIKEFKLFQNYPNPFNPSTIIKYSIPASLNPSKGATLVQLKIYDILGREIATLVNKEQAPGNYQVIFDASNISSGIYFYMLKAGKYHTVNKMIYLR